MRKADSMKNVVILIIAVITFLAMPFQVQAGNLTGKVTWKGDIPKVKPVPVDKDHEKCGKEKIDPVLVVNAKNKGLKNTVVYIENNPGKGKIEKSYPLHMENCNFTNHVDGFYKLATIKMTNGDDILHNPHGFIHVRGVKEKKLKHPDYPWSTEGKGIFNNKLVDSSQFGKKKLRLEGIIRIQCDSHAHMNGWRVGFSHGYWSVTDADGNFNIANVKPGKYKVIAWHESYVVHEVTRDRPHYADPAYIVKEIEVKAGGGKGNFEFSDKLFAHGEGEKH
tara:strand:+ start:1073 stop:1906 length:834 start_codon:yes stop_codon:yes gene_type:complete